MMIPGYDVIAAVALILCIVLLALWERAVTRAERAEARAREAEALAEFRAAHRDQVAHRELEWRDRAMAAEAKLARYAPAGRDGRGRFQKRA